MSIFRPIHRGQFDAIPKGGQRYRHPFGDIRLSRRVKRTLARLSQRRHSTIHRCSNRSSEIKAMYRLLSNDKVSLPELIDEVTKIDGDKIKGGDFLIPLDASSFNLKIGRDSRKEWADLFGVVDDNRSPGFIIMPSLILDASSKACIGLGDILFQQRPKMTLSAEDKKVEVSKRKALPLHEKESGMWSLVALQTALQLELARRLTFIMDQGGDSYQSFQCIIDGTGRDIIARLRSDRQVIRSSDQKLFRSSQLLDNQEVDGRRIVFLRSLNHISKSSGKLCQRTAHHADLEIKYAQIELCAPKQ